MSSIPNAAMPHAHVHHDEDVAKPTTGSDWTKATDAVKSHPKTAIAVGATVLAGVAAAIAVPALRTKAPAKKPAARKPAAKKSAAAKTKSTKAA